MKGVKVMNTNQLPGDYIDRLRVIVILYHQGWKIEDIEKISGMSKRDLRNWIRLIKLTSKKAEG